jgi:hypothetical protein
MRSFSTRVLTASLATPGEQAGPLPLSPAREGLWFMQRLAPLSTASIFSLQVQRRISRQLSVEVELAALFAAPTLEGFAAVVSAARAKAAEQGQQQDRLADDMQSVLSDLMQ